MKFVLRGRDTFETVENLSLYSIFLGAILFATGTGLSILTSWISAVVAMSGAFIVFIFTTILVLTWFFKERSE